MKESISINNLIIEVGRRCNRLCDHCLRGKSEDVTIEMKYVEKVFSQISHIGCITFSGGEPTLYGKEIEKIVDYIIENEISVNDFYVASNGEIYSHDLMCALVKLYAYIMDKKGYVEVSCYDVSDDQFHNPSDDVVNKLSAFSFFNKRRDIPRQGIINEGLASDNGIGYRYLDYDKKFYVERYGDDDLCVDLMYLNALGYLYADCDYSYATQRANAILNCEQHLLSQIFLDEKFSDVED